MTEHKVNQPEIFDIALDKIKIGTMVEVGSRRQFEKDKHKCFEINNKQLYICTDIIALQKEGNLDNTKDTGIYSIYGHDTIWFVFYNIKEMRYMTQPKKLINIWLDNGVLSVI